MKLTSHKLKALSELLGGQRHTARLLGVNDSNLRQACRGLRRKPNPQWLINLQDAIKEKIRENLNSADSHLETMEELKEQNQDLLIFGNERFDQSTVDQNNAQIQSHYTSAKALEKAAKQLKNYILEGVEVEE